MTTKFAAFGQKSLLMQSGIAAAFKLVAAAFSFALTLLIARSLAKDDAGFVFAFISVVSIAATFARLGTDNAILRYTATSGLRDLRFLSHLGLIILVGCVLTSIIGVFYLLHLGKEVDAALMTGSILVATCSTAIGIFIGFALRGAGLTQTSVWLQSGGLPAFACLLLLGAMFFDIAIQAAFTISIYTVAAFVNALIALSLFLIFKSRTNSPAGQSILAFLIDSRPLFLMAVIQVVTQWVPILLIGEMSGLAAAAEFQVASRIAMLIGLIQAGLTTVTAPKLAKAWHSERVEEVFSLYRKAARYSIILSTIAVLVIMLLSNRIVMLFGSFEKSVPILVVLLIGQLFGAYSGPIISLLTMTHNQRLLKLPALASGLFVVVVGSFAGKTYGAIGVAVAVACATAAQNALALLAAKERLGITYFKA